MRQKEIIQCTYKGQPARVFTCLSAEEAEELRSRWPDGIVVLERIHETPALRSDDARSWLVKAVCRILKIEDWQSVDAECSKRDPSSYPRTPLERPDFRFAAMTSTPAELAPSGSRRTRGDRLRHVGRGQ